MNDITRVAMQQDSCKGISCGWALLGIVAAFVIACLLVVTNDLQNTVEIRTQYATTCYARLDEAEQDLSDKVQACNNSTYTRQRRIFQWEVCSLFENCWNCIFQTGVENGRAGDVEFCVEYACDHLYDGLCSQAVDDWLSIYFEFQTSSMRQP